MRNRESEGEKRSRKKEPEGIRVTEKTNSNHQNPRAKYPNTKLETATSPLTKPLSLAQPHVSGDATVT